jgi:signal transduction histidine kinase
MADVAHELRTPLTAIQGTLEGIQDGVLPCDHEQLVALYTETLLLNRLIGDLRLLSLAESSQLKLELQETDPCMLIQQIVDRMQSQAIAKSIRLQTNFRTKILTLQLDPDRITQVISNLLTNALRYTDEGGTILVETTQVSPSTPFMISVSDTGQGIDPENLPFVFDRFFRVEKSRSRASGGSGLGLAIVKELVEAHGGKVSVESPIFFDAQPEYGTRFIIELPSKA